jgi:[protein-PII] uridylyltransferase
MSDRLQTQHKASPATLRERTTAKALELLDKLDLPEGTALAATGSLARGEMSPKSDLDLLLIHEPDFDTSQVKDLWYPVWDAKMRLDYAVRTPGECADIISADVTSALALLDIKHIRGNAELSEQARRLVLETWRREAKRNFNHLVDAAIARWRRSGSVVAMTHPDLKHGRGGLRDIDLVNALAFANLVDRAQLDTERALLNDVRTLLHVHAGRARDQLDPEFAVDVADDLGFTDRYELSRAIAAAAAKVDDAVTQALTIARNQMPRHTGLRRAARRPIDVDVVEVGGELVLSKNPDMTDPGLLLRVSAASARHGLPVTSATWKRLKELPPLPERFTRTIAADFLTTLSSATQSTSVVQEMDEHGFWTQLVPEWDHIRGLMPREPIHIHTIDRHSLAVVANCAEKSITVARPDLLLLAALYHDVGKGRNRPHEEVGAEFVERMAKRMGLNAHDVNVVRTVVAQHTLLPDVCRTLDPTGDDALEKILEATGYDLLTIDLLEALVEADSKGTGPGVWTKNLERGLRILCGRARERLSVIIPEPPCINVAEEIEVNVLDDEKLDIFPDQVYAEVKWKGANEKDVNKLLALMAAKNWNIEQGAIRVSPNDSADDGATTAKARFVVYNHMGSGFNEQEVIQGYRSGRFSTLPELSRGMAATFWSGDLLEVRATDRKGALGKLINVLPDVEWMTMSNPGATMIVQIKLAEGFNRSAVERDVVQALTKA